MREKANPDATRRALLIGAATLAGLPLVAEPRKASAAGTLPKVNAKYQTGPKGAQQCDNCTYYVPGNPPTCKVVAGPVAPNAWCILYAPKPK